MKLNLPKALLALAACGIAVMNIGQDANSFSSGPPAGSTGGLGEPTCLQCHNNTLVANNQAVTLSISNYTPGGGPVAVTLRNASTVGSNYGFQLKVVTANDVQAGTLVAGTGQQIVAQNGITYLEHSQRSSTGTWNFTWTPPATDIGDVTFYIASYNGNSNGSPNSTVSTRAITLSPVTSLENPIVKNSLKVFPNPATTVSQVQYSLRNPSNVTLQVLDATGKLVSSHSLGYQAEGDHNYSLPIAGHIAPGLYTLRLASEGHTQTKALVVQ